MKKDEDSDEKKSERRELAGNFIYTFVVTFFVLIAVIQILLKFAGFTLLNVRTGSMEPNYPINSLLFVRKTDPTEIEKGDVITFVIDENGTFVTHRVVGIDIENHTFTTKGDANNTEDGEVLWDNVVGRVIFKIPKVGYVFMVVTAPENRVYVIAVIAVLLGISFGVDLVKLILRKRRNKNAEGRIEKGRCLW